MKLLLGRKKEIAMMSELVFAFILVLVHDFWYEGIGGSVDHSTNTLLLPHFKLFSCPSPGIALMLPHASYLLSFALVVITKFLEMCDTLLASSL